MAGTNGGGRPRTLSGWQAVGLSVALLWPSVAATITPQGSAGAYVGGAYSAAGRAVPPTFAVAAAGVPWPASPGRWPISLAALWLAVGLLVAMAIPNVSRRIGDGLLSAEGPTPPARGTDETAGAATARPGLAG